MNTKIEEAKEGCEFLAKACYLLIEGLQRVVRKDNMTEQGRIAQHALTEFYKLQEDEDDRVATEQVIDLQRR